MSVSKDELINITKALTKIEYLEKDIRHMEENFKRLENGIKDFERERTESKRYLVAILLAVISLLTTIILKVADFLSSSL